MTLVKKGLLKAYKKGPVSFRYKPFNLKNNLSGSPVTAVILIRRLMNFYINYLFSLIHEIKDVLNTLELTDLFASKFLSKFVVH